MPWPPPIQALPIPKRTFLLLSSKVNVIVEPYTRCTERVADDFCGFARGLMSYSRVGYQIDEGDFRWAQGFTKSASLAWVSWAAASRRSRRRGILTRLSPTCRWRLLAKAWSVFATASSSWWGVIGNPAAKPALRLTKRKRSWRVS